ncbi:RNA polymerase sigma-I factor [Heliobacterium chlorum]|uniref:RNA polymerase sigma factor SigI n=1 Tax=Heliobacterium chlorum TaxID=2698 RepID=A0ABR7T7P6_HELCL|nr:RNA polymerase sigma-I factor [Heliobacterium chlorum]MBC9786646.1 RNA polymerase sigma-I factor [Heliobacterium chlorum]
MDYLPPIVPPEKRSVIRIKPIGGLKRGGITEGTNLFTRIHQGDEPSREQLIADYKDRIVAIASRICKRPLLWNNDDELSIALIAFNEAIDTYRAEKGAAFTTHVHNIIRFRLIDHFRREERNRHISLDGWNESEQSNRIEQATSLEAYRDKQEAEEQEMTMSLFVEALQDFGISLDELVRTSPKHKDTKANLIRAAKLLVANTELRQRFFTTRQIPMKELVVLSGLSRKVLETGRKYIVAVAIVLADDEFTFVRSFLTLSEQK